MSGNQMILLGGSQAPAVDPYFYSVTSLLHGDGTNGGQNNTFLDSSTNNFTITRNGNTTQGSFSPFSQTGWSNYFDGSSLLTFASSANYVPGSGEFCLECWFMPTSTGTDRWLIGNRNNNYVPFAIVYTGSSAPTALLFYMSSNGSTWDVINGGYAYGVTANRWNHLALVRSGTSIIAYINGIGTTLATSSANFSTAQPFYVGGSPAAGDPEFVGYISNVRFVKGSTPYSGSTITVPTTPLTAITNTQLLTSQSNRFLDNSTNAVTPSITGSPSVQPFSPFNPITAYSTSAVGGSGYFDGSGDYLSAGDQTAFEFGSGDYTVELWWYPTSSGDQNIIGKWDTGGTEWILQWRSAGYYRWASGGSVVSDSSTITLRLNSWNHVAVTKSGTSLRIYTNGAQINTTATEGTISATSTALTVGASQLSSSPLNVTGYMSDVRILKGTAQYTGSTYTVPTAPLTAIANTSLLLNFTNGAIFDNAAVADYETVGNAQISTSVKKYGTGSIAFDGTGDWLVSPASPSWDFGSGDFTIELWVNPSATTAGEALVSKGNLTSIGNEVWTLQWFGTNQLAFFSGGGLGTPVVNTGSIFATGNWYHVAVCRAAGVTKIFVNGTVQGTSTTSYTITAGGELYVGAGWYAPASRDISGYIDDLRISKGVARYPYNFTPPTAEFPNIGGTVTLTADPYFDYTTLLLPGNGTNGAQNNTFLDSSTNAFSITRNGNTTQGTFSPFSQTGWGNNFVSGSYLSAASNAAFAPGTGDFTVEAWINHTSAYTTYNYILGVTVTGGLVFYVLGGVLVVRAYNVGDQLTSTYTPPLNQWTHVAAVRSGTTLTIYANGTAVASTTNSYNFVQGAAYVGNDNTNAAPWLGYISNLRFVKGTAVYTSNFTPPTAPLTAITNTSLLTCQSNRFIDNSSNAFSLTRNGDVSVQAFSPFNPTASWSAATNGGSGYFDGSGDYLNTTSTQVIPSGSFTVEAWAYLTTSSSTATIVAQGTSGNAARFSVGIEGGLWWAQIGSTAVNAGTPVTNTWTHLAVTFNGSTLTLYVNGTSVGTASTSTNAQNTTLRIGSLGPVDWSTYYWPGYIGQVRISNTVRSISVPTALYTADANTTFLANFTNAGIYDATSKNDLETVGNAQISTTQSKFGGSSMYFDGTGDYLVTPSSVNLQYGTGDFTIEFWWYPTTLASLQTIIYHTNDSGVVGAGEFVIVYNTSVGIRFYVNSGAIDITQGSTSGWSANNWYHVAVARYGNTLTIYRNGISVASGSVSGTTVGANVPTYIGGEPFDPFYMTGYIDDLRITKGIARYTSNFTPPTTAFLTL